MIRGFDRVVRQRLALLPFAVSPAQLLSRDIAGGLGAPGVVSANGSCRLLRARDGWTVLNLARGEDRDLIPALTFGLGDDWDAVDRFAATIEAAQFVETCAELHLPGARLGEAAPIALAGGGSARGARVLDLSAMWAGPLCAGLLARAGASVRRIASISRPDPVAVTSPLLDRWLNGAKAIVPLDLRTPEGRKRLRDEVLAADVLVTSARPSALARLGLDMTLFEERPALVWMAITAHGWAVERVGFGDDCAVAGGLVRYGDGEPRFAGDALADPLTGLEAALAALARIGGRGGLVDIALAGVAAAYAARLSR